jgi:hypothetical protein
MMRDLVLSMAAGYNFEQVSRFTETLFENSPTAKLVFFISEHEDSFLLAKQRFNNLDYAIISPGLRPGATMTKLVGGSTRALLNILSPISKLGYFRNCLLPRILIPHCKRYVIALDYLNALDEKPDRILLSDSIDVYFQDDPFENVSKGLYCGRESVRIYYERFNYAWLSSAFTKNEVSLMEGNIVSCSGVTIGDYASIHIYLGLMKEIFIERLPYAAGRIFDQAAHNWLVYSRPHDLNITWCENGDRQIFTAGTSLMREVDIDEGVVKTKNNEAVAIVHQLRNRNE